MEILQLCNKIPYPPTDGGAIAMHNIANIYTNLGYKVTVLAMNTDKHRYDVNKIPDSLRSKINFIYVNVNTQIRIPNLLANFFFSRKPYNAIRFKNKKFQIKLIELLNSKSFDIIQLEGLYLKPYVKLIRKTTNAKIVYRAHNIENEIWKGIATYTKNHLKRLYIHSLAKRILRYEKGFINQYNYVLPISTADEKKLREMGNKMPSHVTYTSISNSEFNKVANLDKAKDLFFIGALDWIPNQEGLIWFLDRVWRKLKAKFPDLELHIAGRNAPDWIVNKCTEANTIFHGEVPLSAEFFDAHDIMVVPLFAGSGIRIKIIEAMARSKAIVTTKIGVQGIPLIHPHDIIISDSDASMIRQITRLLDNPELFQKISTNSYQFASKYFSESNISTGLNRFFKDRNLC